MRASDDRAVLLQVCESRTVFYAFLASLYYDVLTDEQIETMAQADCSRFEKGNELMESGFNHITRFLRKRHTGTRQMLAADYTSVFGGTSSYEGKVAVPYASVFLSSTGLLNREPRNRALAAYRAAGLDVTAPAIPADHLSFELKFMGLLSERAAEAVSAGSWDVAREAVMRSQVFLGEHIMPWFPLLKALALHLVSTRFYWGVLDLTDGYLQLDAEVLAEMVDELGEADD